MVLTGRQRALCTVLLLHADRVVSVERVIRYLWGEQPPSAGAARVRALVAEVRRAFGSLGTHSLATQSPGYVLRTTPGHLDLLTFEALIRDGSRAVAGGDWTRAYDYHDRALSLWRGDPLTDLPAVEAERQRLSELRIAASEGKAVAEIALGRHGDAIAELVRITARHPLRERPHALLMRALQQDGRTAEALEIYASLRKRMVDELGVDPSDEIRDLHQRLLTVAPMGALPCRQIGRGISGFHDNFLLLPAISWAEIQRCACSICAAGIWNRWLWSWVQLAWERRLSRSDGPTGRTSLP